MESVPDFIEAQYAQFKTELGDIRPIQRLRHDALVAAAAKANPMSSHPPMELACDDVECELLYLFARHLNAERVVDINPGGGWCVPQHNQPQHIELFFCQRRGR